MLNNLLASARTYASLARWLGPWASEDDQPHRVVRTNVDVDAPGGRSFPARLYLPPRQPSTVYLIAPGLHYAGPADPRMDRFCAILAASGAAVFAPFLPDYIDLRVQPRALSDFEAAFDAMVAHPRIPTRCKPTVFSISFGSLLALRLAATPEYADRVGALVLFGGYLDWHDTIRFCLTGTIDGELHGKRDPLNQPVVFMNLIDDIDGAPADPTELLAAWRRYVEATWGRNELKVGGRHREAALRFATEVQQDQRDLFLIGCGAEPGGFELCEAALQRAPDRSMFLDPRPFLADIRAPVHLVHGRDDDVIPHVQTERLAEALRPHTRASVYLTGLYGHTSQAVAARGSALARELLTMARILRVFTNGGAV